MARLEFHLAEIGPGRGTMMADIIRVIKKLAPDMFEAAQIHLIETSERLRKVQAQTLVADKWKITWHDGFDGIPEGPLLLAANELFDAIPIRQFVKTPTGFRERMVGLDADDNLTFAAGMAGVDPALLAGPRACSRWARSRNSRPPALPSCRRSASGSWKAAARR